MPPDPPTQTDPPPPENVNLAPEQIVEIEAARTRTAETRRATVPALENILYTAFSVLDHGFVRVVDYMGDDSAVVQAARVSYGHGTKSVRSDEGLIRYLMRHRHTTPFEMCEIKLHVKLPIFVARQWLRHRTANVNEYSARYSRLDREFYVPDPAHLQPVIEQQARKQRAARRDMEDFFEPEPVTDEHRALAGQSEANKQGRAGAVGSKEGDTALSRIYAVSRTAYGAYENLLNEDDRGRKKRRDEVGLTRELARTVLPVNYYTQFYWKADLHNLLHFLSLRADAHAQYEIRRYAEVILDQIVKHWVPLTYRAFLDYRLNAAGLSAPALDVVRRMIAGETVTQEEADFGDREWRELMQLLGR